MKIACLQMNMLLGQPEKNFQHAAAMIHAAMAVGPDVLVLPETWNTGFFPRENLPALCDRDGVLVRERLGTLAAAYHVNIVAGSVSNLKNGSVFNTALVFDREGACVAEYDKTHLFSPMGENTFYTPGEQLCHFSLDGVPCALITCYDLRFPELTRSLALRGADALFVVSQWPKSRLSQFKSLAVARAIENQMFVVCCNSCGTTGETVFGGGSCIIDPLGEILALAGNTETTVSAKLDTALLPNLRKSIPVFCDRRPELYILRP